MELDNLNDIITHLKKMNEEVIQCKLKSDVDLKAYNELKAQYMSKSKELEETHKKVDHLKRLCKVLEEKLSKFLTVRSEYQKLGNRMKRMQRKLELTIRENKAYERELEDVKIMFNTTSSDAGDSVSKVIELQEVLKEREKEYKENLERVRSEARRSLITLESKILERVKNEYTKDNVSLSDEVKRKLVDNEYIIEALNLANLKLKEKLELKEYQYQELENNYLVLKVNSQTKQKSSENLSFSKRDDRSDSYNKSLMARNIDEVIRELKSSSEPNELRMLLSNTSCRSLETQQSQSESTNIGFGNSHMKNKSPDYKYQYKSKKRSAEIRSSIANEASLDTLLFPPEGDIEKNRKYKNDYYEFIEEIFVGPPGRDDDPNTTEMSDNETFENTEELVSLKDIDCMGEFKIDIKENEISVEVKRCCNSESSSTEKLLDFNRKYKN